MLKEFKYLPGLKINPSMSDIFLLCCSYISEAANFGYIIIQGKYSPCQVS